MFISIYQEPILVEQRINSYIESEKWVYVL